MDNRADVDRLYVTHRADLDRLYVRRNGGGRGLISVEDCDQLEIKSLENT